MSRRLQLRAPLVVLAVLCAALVQVARADGEVGLVIEKDGQTTTYCVAYKGDGISGDNLLTSAGFSFEEFGNSSGATLCAIDDTGCFDPSSFNSCFCQCSGGSECTYWAFFTRDYGSSWVYSTRAFDRTTANDGDLQAWRWGQGSLNSAPRPDDSVTFEAVCGHAPRGGAVVTATQPSPDTTGPTQTSAPATSAPSTGAMETPFTQAPSSTAAAPSVSVTLAGTPGETSTASSQPVAATDDDNDGGSAAGLVVFGAVTVALVTLVAGAALWRRRHGA